MNIPFLRNKSYQLSGNNVYSQFYKNFKESMDSNDEGLMNMRKRKLSSRNNNTREQYIKYYIRNTRPAQQCFNKKLNDSNIFSNKIKGRLSQEYTRKTDRHHSDDKLIEKTSYLWYSPLKFIKATTVTNINLTKVAKEVINLPVNVFQACHGKVSMVMDDRVILIRHSKFEKGHVGIKFYTEVSVQDLYDEKHFDKYLPTKEHLKVTESDKVRSNLSASITPSSNGYDDVELLPKNFRRLESSLIDDIMFPSLVTILKDNNVTAINDPSNLTLKTAIDQSIISFKNDYTYSIVVNLIEEGKRTFLENSSSEYTDYVIEDDFINKNSKNAHFEMEKIFDESLSTDFLKNEDETFQLALQYTEALICNSKTAIRRSNSGNKLMIDNNNRHYKIVEYFGNFGFIDGINLQYGFPLLKIRSSPSDLDESESNESFQALSHMCHLQGLMERKSIFQAAGGAQSKNLFVHIQRAASSDRSLAIGQSQSVCSVDDYLINAFTERIKNETQPQSKSSFSESQKL